MKKVINGAVYNSATAEELGSRASNLSDNLTSVWESLYRTKAGKYFVYGTGGPMTQYAVREGSDWAGGSKIIPLTYTEAQQWAEKYLDGDDYERIFGAVPEDDTPARLHLHVTAACAETIRRRAAQQGVTASEYVEALVMGTDK